MTLAEYLALEAHIRAAGHVVTTQISHRDGRHELIALIDGDARRFTEAAEYDALLAAPVQLGLFGDRRPEVAR